MKPVQYFSDEYLAQTRGLSAEEIAQFVESFRELQAANAETSKLISLKVPESLLNSFRKKCAVRGLKYQTQIKQLMRDWVESNE